jgi:Zn-dependent metalloprotease
VFGRNSLDDGGMSLISSVHVGEADGGDRFQPMNNAFWDGSQMAYGDGDGQVFQCFTRSLDVVGHELTHGVQSFTSNLLYRGQSGALNEHFSDVFGILVRQWRRKESATEASWLIGREVLVPAPTRRGIRDMEHPGTAYRDDPALGTDPQPDHMSKLYVGSADSGGVHINSGIPNRAFVLVAQALVLLCEDARTLVGIQHGHEPDAGVRQVPVVVHKEDPVWSDAHLDLGVSVLLEDAREAAHQPFDPAVCAMSWFHFGLWISAKKNEKKTTEIGK